MLHIDVMVESPLIAVVQEDVEVVLQVDQEVSRLAEAFKLLLGKVEVTLARPQVSLPPDYSSTHADH